jgi:pimeloyl-ACP methyl ester carboxylesterase
MRTLVALVVILVSLAAILLSGLRLASMIREVGVLPVRIPEEGRMVETALGPIYVEELGPEGGTPVLLVHGSIGWSRIWRPTAEALAAEGYRAIAFDMPPMGWSFRDPAGDYSRQTQARRLLALVATLGVKPILVAHSIGAGPAAEAAMLQPEAVAGLVVVSGQIGLGRDGTGLTPPWPLGYPLMRELVVSATLTNPMATGAIVRRFLHQKDAATPEFIDMLNRPNRRAGTTAALADWLPSQIVAPAGALSTSPDAWSALALPLALIWGEQDSATPPEEAQALADLTGAPLSILPEVGHIPQIEAPAAFQAALIAALAKMTPTDTP